jgi:hypothetical protein
MKLQKAERKNAKIRMGLQGPSGSGKTMSALLLAFGMTSNWSKIAVIDTENHSSELYSHLGSYQVLHLEAPFTPERYIQAINMCEEANIEVIIIDSLSHEWNGAGGILEVHGSMAGNSFTNWSKLTPRHNQLVNAILQSSAHIISNIRSKQEYVLTDKNGKMVPEKVGMSGVQREGLDYEMTLVLDINIKHQAIASKDRTGLFINSPEFTITSETGNQILEWCNSGLNQNDVEDMITRSNDIQTLREIFNNYPEFQKLLSNQFTKKKDELQNQNPTVNTFKTH